MRRPTLFSVSNSARARRHAPRTPLVRKGALVAECVAKGRADDIVEQLISAAIVA